MKVVIIGGSGGMGQLFLKFFKRNKVSVKVVGRATRDYKKQVESSDVIIISTPISAVKKVVNKISKYDLPGKLVINFASNMLEGMDNLSLLKCDSCCMHALFGPDISNFKDQNIVVAPLVKNKNLEKIIGLLKNEGARVVKTSPGKHDEIMAYLQALSQFSSIGLAKTISESGVPARSLHDFSSVSFRLNAAGIERIMMQPAELWANIEFFNEKFPDILERHFENMEELREIVLEKNFEKFKEKFDEAKKYWREERVEDYEEVKKQLGEISKKDSIAVLGPRGTFSQQAAMVYNEKLRPVFFDSIGEVIGAVADGVLDIGIVPIENSIYGTVIKTIDETYKRKLKIIEEIVIPIRHVAAGTNDVLPVGDVVKVYSHPQGLNQCKGYLEENFSSAKFIQTPSTASAFEKIKGEGLVDSIAIGPKIAAEIYGLKVIKEDVQDEGNNETSFVVIKRESSESSSADKTTIVVNPKVDRPGLLYDILEVFKGKGVNLSKIESRPSRDKLGSYIFYLTLDIGENPLLVKIIEELEAMHIEVYNFGSYNRIRV